MKSIRNLSFATLSLGVVCAFFVGCLIDARKDAVSFRFDLPSTLAGTYASPPGSQNGYLYSMSGGRAGFEIPFKAMRNPEGDTVRAPAFELCRLGTGSEGYCPDFVTLYADSTATFHAFRDSVSRAWGRTCVVRHARLQVEVQINGAPVMLELDAQAVYAKRFQGYLLIDTTLPPPPMPDSLTVLRFIVDSAEAIVNGDHINLNLHEFTGSAELVCRSDP